MIQITAPHFCAAVFVPKLLLDRLDKAVAPLSHAWGQEIFLVGSSLQHSSFNDLDVRAVHHGYEPELVTLLDVVVSGYLTAKVGFPVDFQLVTAVYGDRVKLGGPVSVVSVRKKYDIGQQS